MVNREGLIMTTNGDKVLSSMGAEIFLPPEQRPTFDSDGTIRAADQIIAQLGLVAIAADAQLKKDSQGRLIPPGGEKVALNTTFSVHQGHLEGSNVKPVEMMVKLINVQRNFEALNQVIQTYRRMDSAANRLVR
jgi:flagellar basal body rod protein FlgG